MSTEVLASTTIAPLEDAPAPVAPAVEESAAPAPTATAEEVSPSAVDDAQVASPDEEEAVTPAAAHAKRTPFSDLKNKFFANKPTTAAAPAAEEATKETEVAAPAVEETATENVAPVVPAATDESAPAPAAEAAATEAATEVPAAAETPVKETPKKVKGPGVFEKLKEVFGGHKDKAPKEKKVAAPAVAVEAPATEEAAAPAEAEAEAAAPVVEEAPVVAAVEEPTAVVAAPVEEVKETEVAPEASTSDKTVEEAAAVKFDAAAKSEEKPKGKIDLLKIGRRLSARFGSSSPKKEKADPIVTAEAPKITTAVDESAIVAEEPKAAEAAVEAEAPKVEEVAAPAPAVVEEVAAPAPAVIEAEVAPTPAVVEAEAAAVEEPVVIAAPASAEPVAVVAA